MMYKDKSKDIGIGVSRSLFHPDTLFLTLWGDTPKKKRKKSYSKYREVGIPGYWIRVKNV